MAAVKYPLTLGVVRRLAAITQEELAAHLNVTQGALSNWESGAYPLPAGAARIIMRVLKPKLRSAAKATDATGAALRNLKAEELSQPWDAVLLAAAKLEEEKAS